MASVYKMLWRNVLPCLGGLLLLIAISKGSKLNIFLRTMQYEVPDNVSLKYFNASMVQRKGRNVVHVDFEFRRNVTAFDIRMWARVPNKVHGNFFDLNFNGCDVIQKNFSGPFIGKVVVDDLRYGNTILAERCPFVANKVYNIDQFYLHAERFPVLTPEMNLVANISWSMEKKPTWSMQLLFEFVKS